MHWQCRRLFIANLLLHSSIYAVNNFFVQILKQTNVCSPKQFCLAQLLFFIKFLGVLIFSNLADRKRIHRNIIGINSICFAFALLFFVFAEKVSRIYLRRILVLSIFTLYHFFLSGTLGLLDSLTYNLIEQKGLPFSYYGKIRLGGTCGNITIHCILTITYIFIEKYPPNIKKIYKNNFNLGYGFIFGILAGLMCLFGCPKYRKIQKIEIHDQNNSKKLNSKECLNKGENKKFNWWKRMKILLSLTTPLLILYSLALLFQGIDRITLTNYMTEYLDARNVERSLMHLTFIIRNIPEFMIYSFSQNVEKVIGIDMMFMIASFISTLRTFFFAFENFDFEKNFFAKIMLMFFELGKGFYSSFLNYSSLRIFRLLVTDETASFGQGLYNGIYNALSPVIFSPIGYFILEYQDDDVRIESLKQLFLVTGIICSFSCLVPVYAVSSKKWRMKQKRIQ